MISQKVLTQNTPHELDVPHNFCHMMGSPVVVQLAIVEAGPRVQMQNNSEEKKPFYVVQFKNFKWTYIRGHEGTSGIGIHWKHEMILIDIAKFRNPAKLT